MATARTLLVLSLGALALTACGGGGGGGGSANGGGGGGGKGLPNGGGGVNGISVANCLNSQDFLVQPSQTTVDGTSPNGISFALIFYKDAAAAKAAAAKKSSKTTALVEDAVIDFKGNPSIYAGAPPAKISKGELATIKTCIDQNRGK